MRLNLPVQGTIDRSTPYDLPLVELAEDHTGKETLVFMGRPGGVYGHDPRDPAPALDLDSRGWSCQPVSGCMWQGLI